MKLFLLAACLFVPLHAQSDVAGRILDKVVCEEDASQSYALYVPSNYTKSVKWPVIFCFDASARGRVPVERLQEAAEKYGYIVAGSLTSRNGPWAANSAAARAMVKDVSAHFSIDVGRIYTAGVSGGARVATAFGLSGLAKGVIACSAGFPIPDRIPDHVPFVFFGTAGIEDFNYWEMRRLDQDLSRRRAVHRTVIFNGGHEWASTALLTEAVEWLELQSMQAGVRKKNADFIASQFKSRVAGIPAPVGIDRWQALQSLVADFSGLMDVGDFEKEEKQLGDSREVKEALKKETIAEVDESDLVKRLGEVAMEGANRNKTFAADLRRKADASVDSPERAGVRRALASYVFTTRETVRRLFEEEEYEDAAAVLAFVSLLKPGEKQTFYDLARARALSGDKKRAVESLRSAVDAGIRDAERIQSEPAFVNVADDAGFKELIARLKHPAESVMEMPVLRVFAVLASVELRVFSQPNVESADRSLSFLRVEKVRPDSPAARAGIAPGMEIVAIQGVKVRGLAEDELDRVMQQPVQKEIVLVVREPPRRGEWEIRIPVTKQ